MASCSSVAALRDRRLSTSSGADHRVVSSESCLSGISCQQIGSTYIDPSDSTVRTEASRMMRIVGGSGRGFHSALLARMKAFNRGGHVGIHHRSEVEGHELGE